MKISEYRFDNEEKVSLEKSETDISDKNITKEIAEEILAKNILKMAELQSKLYAQTKYSVLIIFQAMDTGGKDSAIKHVMSGLNPQGTQVYSLKEPSPEELRHDYLWRANKHLPERGQIGIFNRSYYEELLVVKVHDLVKYQNIPEKLLDKDIWKQRYRQVNDYERYLTENGVIVIKLFLHISKDEQKRRLLERIDDKTKNWKFAESDIKERKYWEQYQECYEDMLEKTGTKRAPWYVIPANKKWYSRYIISEIIVKQLEELGAEYPVIGEEQVAVLEKCKKMLLEE